MSEESAPIEQAATSADTTGLALDIALEAARNDPAHRAKIDAFLGEQISLIALQKHHLLEQFKQLGPSLWEKRLGVMLRLATVVIGLTIAAAAAFLVWNAAESNDLVIDAFAVPPDLAVRGMSGPVVAAKLSDRIAAMQAQTGTARPAKSYTNSFNEEPKIEIPETGVSLSELDRFLRQKLGHDLHIGGEVVQTENGLVLTARAGANGSATVTGPAADMDGLVQRLAEAIYRITQPYRYGSYLRSTGRSEEGLAIVRELAMKGPVQDRVWAFLSWANYARERQGERAAEERIRHGIATDPNHYLLYSSLADSEEHLGHTAQQLRYLQQAVDQLSAHGTKYRDLEDIPASLVSRTSQISWLKGNMQEATSLYRRWAAMGKVDGSDPIGWGALFLGLHEVRAARDALEGFSIQGVAARAIPSPVLTMAAAALEAGDWQAVMDTDRLFAVVVTRFPGFAEAKRNMIDPLAALALAHMGQREAAQARIAATALDCYPCLRARGQLAALYGDNAGADSWFARAVSQAPSMPYAESEWGKALLTRGEPDAAAEKFALANKKSAHFADPLEGWGEALMAKNQSHLALTKFEEANKYAPNWGRLHLKWGEALVYAGKKEEARAHFTRAAGLDLTQSEKQELARLT